MTKWTTRTLSMVLALILTFAAAAAATRPQVIPPESPEITAVRQRLDSHVDELSARVIEMSDWLYHNPESGFLEFKAAAMLTDELAKHGFEVEMGVPGLEEAWPEFDRLKFVGGLTPTYSGPPGLPTAFRAKYHGKNEHPVICFVVEYDALRGDPPFHGCQHNMQGPSGVGAAIALAKSMEEHGLPGSVWVVGAPAEEVGPPTKAALAKANYLGGVDFAIRSHGTATDTVRYPGGFSPRHIRQMKYTFHGKPAHAQSAWQGRSALDAVMLLFHAVDMLREHSEPQFRFHGIVSDGGVAPNIVPEMASATIWVRHLADETPLGSVSPKKASEMIDAKVVEIHNAARGAALATGTTVDIDLYGTYAPSVAIGAFNDLAFQYAVDYGGVNIKQANVPRHWEETGFLTLQVPGVHVSIGTAGIPAAAGHSPENAAITLTPEGHENLIQTTKVMAAVGLRLVMDGEMREAIKAEHAKWLEQYDK
ncbi:MAG: peptidase dimerization domain-containing protein [Firmicutes bacterium]|nr:peptidase dimerization domain-containing protein [Bacillota bacterium]